jgi:hypothetical protein
MILARSTYNQNFTVPALAEKLTTRLYARFGDNTDALGAPNVTRTRTIPTIDTPSVDLQFDQFIKDRLNPKPVWYSGTSGIVDSSTLANLWATITFNFDDDSSSNKLVNVISTKGWYNYLQGLNASTNKTMLTPSNYLQVERGQPIIIPVHVIENANLKVTTQAGANDYALTTSTLSTKRIQYLFFDNYSDDDKYITIDYEGVSKQAGITVEIIDECKFDVKQLIYLNRFGVFQQLFCFKRSIKNLSTTQETFKNAFISGGTYDTTKHQYKDFNKQGREAIEVNTGFVKEEQNAMIEDLMLSEDVYLREGSVFIPMNLDQRSLTFLTRKVDKVINYTFELEYSFDKIVNL